MNKEETMSLHEKTKRILRDAAPILYMLCVLALVFDVIMNGITMRGLHLFGFLYLFLQLFLCFKVKSPKVKLIPLFPILPLLALAVYGHTQGGLGGGIVMIFAIVLSSVCAFAIILAWIIYFIVYKINDKKKGVTE